MRAWRPLLMVPFGLAGCDAPAPPPPTTLGTVSVGRLETQRSAAVAPPKAPSRHPPVHDCRAVSIRGAVHRQGGEPLARHASLDGSPWLDLEEGASVTVKHARTAREVTVTGPARFAPCYEGREAFLLHHGSLEAVPGAGVRPGAELFIATPLGVVRSADAALGVRMDATLSVTVRTGKAWLDRPGAAPPVAVDPKTPASTSGTAPNVKDSLMACDAAARKSEAVGRALLDRNAQGRTLGERAGEHFQARRTARKACGMAAAVIGGMPAGAERDAALRRLTDAERRWKKSPSKPQVVE